MKDFFNKLESGIFEAIKTEFPKIQDQIKNEKIYAIALVTDVDCISLHLSVNTLEVLEKTDGEYGFDNDENMKEIIEKLQGKLSDEEFDRYKSLPLESTRWNPDEWGYSDFDSNSKTAEISKKLISKNGEMNFVCDDDYRQWQKMFVEIVTSAFNKAIQGGYLGLDSKDVTYFVCMMDADKDGEKIMLDSAKLLNDRNVYEAFYKDNTYDEELMALVDKVLSSAF